MEIKFYEDREYQNYLGSITGEIDSKASTFGFEILKEGDKHCIVVESKDSDGFSPKGTHYAIIEEKGSSYHAQVSLLLTDDAGADYLAYWLEIKKRY